MTVSLSKSDLPLKGWNLNLTNLDKGDTASRLNGKLETSSAVHMADKRRAKADDTRSTNTPHTRVINSLAAAIRTRSVVSTPNVVNIALNPSQTNGALCGKGMVL